MTMAGDAPWGPVLLYRSAVAPGLNSAKPDTPAPDPWLVVQWEAVRTSRLRSMPPVQPVGQLLPLKMARLTIAGLPFAGVPP